MSESQTNTAVAEEEFQYSVKIEDAGPATKKVVVEIPKERIDAKLAEQYKEIRSAAAIPGFRPGRAPQKLVEKRFDKDVKEQVRRALISESYEQAVQKNSLQVIGEPQFDNPDSIQLPDSGGMSYSFQIEVQPDFTIPDLNALKIKKPKIEITEDNVNQAMQNLREQQGMLIPVEDRGVEDMDHLYADVHVKLDGVEIAHSHDTTFVSRPGRMFGVDIVDLDKKLKGMKGGDKREITIKVPDPHPNEQIRGKEVVVEVALKDIKKLELREIDAEFLESLGFENEAQLRDALREQMIERITMDVNNAMRSQVNQYLLDNVKIDLPSKLSDRQEARIVQRRATDLMMRGVAREQIESNVAQLRDGAKDEASRELKLFFILQKIATDRNVDVDEAELNGMVAMIAAQQGKRPEKLKQELAKDGSLVNMYVQLREQKAVDQILAGAQIEEVALQAAEKAAEKKE